MCPIFMELPSHPLPNLTNRTEPKFSHISCDSVIVLMQHKTLQNDLFWMTATRLPPSHSMSGVYSGAINSFIKFEITSNNDELISSAWFIFMWPCTQSTILNVHSWKNAYHSECVSSMILFLSAGQLLFIRQSKRIEREWVERVPDTA